jgi:UDP-GlcNAc:undecaprenyl-phosphate GlcNAc-1-phosphate transferase
MGIDNCWNSPSLISMGGFPVVNILVVILVFLIPLTDTFTVVFNRIKAGKSPFIGGKDHTTHHLFFKGITEKRIAVLYFLISTFGSILAYLLVFRFSYALFYISILYILLVFVSLYLNTVIKKR